MQTAIILAFILTGLTNDAKQIQVTDKTSSQESAAPAPSFEDILTWLPPNTESLLVANGPFECHRVDTKESQDLLRMLRRMCAGPVLGEVQDKKLTGQKISLAVHGGRRFRAPKQLGLGPYEGCSVVVFERDIGKGHELVARSLQSESKQVIRMQQQQVYCFEKQYEKDTWNIYVVQPAKNLLICATDKGYLAEVLRRREKKASDRAFPVALPQWKCVNRKAPFWALREFNGPRAIAGVPAESELPGMVYCFDPANEKIGKFHYFSNSPNAADVLSASWSRGAKATVKQKEAGDIEVIVDATEDKNGNFPFALMLSFGFIFCV